MVAEGEGVETGEAGEVGVQLTEPFAKLALGAGAVAAPVVVEADGEVDEGLEEESLGAARGGPDFFENFVALKKLAAVEQVQAALEQAGCFFAHARIIL